MKKNKRLSRRITTYCFLFGLLLSSSIAVLGILVYQNRALDHYDQYIHNILKITERQVNVKDCERWAETLDDDDEEYRNTQAKINDIKEASQYEMKNKEKEYQINFLFIVSPDHIKNGEVMYIMSAFIDSDREKDANRVPDRLGNTAKAGDGYEDMQKELMDLYLNMVRENADDVSYVDNSNQYYKNLRTGVLPIKNGEGKLVAFINAAVSVDGIQRDVRTFIGIVVMGTVIIMGTFLMFFIGRMNQSVAKPITLLANNTFDFMKQSREKKELNDMVFKRLEFRTGDEIELLSDHLNQMTNELLTHMKNIESITMEKERFQAELNVAKVIQTSMIPSTFPAFPERTDFDVYAILKTANDIGGDFYDFFFVDETHFCMVIASVTGRGIPAALFLVVVRTLIKNYAHMGLTPNEALRETNNRLCENNETNMYVTVFLGILDVHDGWFHYANADHPFPFIKRGGRPFEPLGMQRGFVLAGLEEVSYCSYQIQLMQGDTLFFYTQGLVDRVNRESLRMELNQVVTGEYELEGMLSALEGKYRERVHGMERKEDVTMMAFRYYGN